jgi:hypothetical protein
MHCPSYDADFQSGAGELPDIDEFLTDRGAASTGGDSATVPAAG